MTSRERALAVLNYEKYDEFPLVHFGFWSETIQKWKEEGHIKDGEDPAKKAGFDFEWIGNCHGGRTGVFPGFERKLIETLPDGSQKVMDGNGVIQLVKPGIRSIPAEIDHTLKDRASWEKDFKHRVQYCEERVSQGLIDKLKAIDKDKCDAPLGLHLGSLFGYVRDWVGFEAVSYIYIDDEPLFDEIIDTLGDTTYRVAEKILNAGIKFDIAHFWEDICFKNGPLVMPEVFEEKVGKHYKKVCGLCNKHGINIISLDCDGWIDALVPIWLKNGVNTMFPIEVGTWNASIAPWREKYGKDLRGVGGMNKNVFARDKAAVDAEIERLKPLVALGGYIPCPDHRIAPDAKWENVVYYCEQMRKTF